MVTLGVLQDCHCSLVFSRALSDFKVAGPRIRAGCST